MRLSTSSLISQTLFLAVVLSMASSCASAAETKVPVIFTEGHDTDRRDGGRPVVLIAAALGVKTEVFREAFSGVRPSRNGPPTGEEARRNKQVLLQVLGPHGITNERLDEVSDYYRYRPQRGELWTNVSAKAHAIVENGKIKQIVITNPGSGYSSTPKVSVEGFPNVRFNVTVKYGKELQQNGSISAIELAADKPAKK